MKTVLTLCLSLLSFLSFGQSIEMADTMRSNGKIYVVVAVLVLILSGLVAMLINTDKKVKDLEDKLK